MWSFGRHGAPHLNRWREGGLRSLANMVQWKPLNVRNYDGPGMPLNARKRMDKHVRSFCERNFDKLERELGTTLANKTANHFRAEVLQIDRRVLKRMGTLTLQKLLDITSKKPDEQGDGVFLQALLRHARTNFRREYEQTVQEFFGTDLRLPHEFYPLAREKRRKIIYHHGPTNSGKTYSAVQALKGAKKGVYAGPLRLLAQESYDKLNRSGTYANLRTGQESREVPFSTHLACTVEMLSVEEEYDVIILDEIQLLGDESRGHAWTRALLGANAPEVHVCGDSSALDIVKYIAELCGDDFEDHVYERRTPLSATEEGLSEDYSKLNKGDAVIAFSRQELFRLKNEIESKTDHKCCLIYGNLPPETRSKQARLFNDPTTEYTILVATDAVGMGLNLNIGRVVFTAMEKVHKSGLKAAKLTPPHVRQIAGRAGRDGTYYPQGYATCFKNEDMTYFKWALDQPNEPLKQAGMVPTAEQLLEFKSRQAEDISFSTLLEKYAAVAKLENHFRLCEERLQIMKTIADLIEDEPRLSLQERVDFTLTPINLSFEPLVKEFRRIVFEFATYGYVRLYKDGVKPQSMSGFGRTTVTLFRAEVHCMLLDMYIYLANTIGWAAFIDKDIAVAIRSCEVAFIDTLLKEARYVAPAKNAEDGDNKANSDEGDVSSAERRRRSRKPVSSSREELPDRDASDAMGDDVVPDRAMAEASA
mmetsp:Transcript_4486/g.13608  ORF Transcript_4486/g.13608 Transcript_4486/m.13608 type:complete len:704 (+) Transcript_4486:161-2272(+)|eukprot:CAMPEP_0198725922 /NCGR_PEP_ID=MMETSP1475-20131203/3117_1 /TAXON_ID= ORGANISM="Unidentified sp., Strain CCMP1999" /NCGR_SAMPLE_ID=MMETSP1475 /ASSEMBLY_ACC=CAM_ASM_001111 /LENGTH=703 /DNA_ID=CAMNT_0044487777 /DNA_START=83 /DNA_END=2194 /DNA_ORIENTATION=-